MQYKPLYKANQIICGVGITVVVTGWTVKETVHKRLLESDENPESLYAGIGSLYSSVRGINILVRNILANPHVTTIVAINATQADKNSRAVECLGDFFLKGISASKTGSDKDCWKVNSQAEGFIDKAIPYETLQLLRQEVRYIEVKSIEQAVTACSCIAKNDTLVERGSRGVFEMEEVETKTLPGRRYGHVIHGDTIASTWVKIIQLIKTTGTPRPTQHGGHWQELIDLTAVVTSEPDNFYFPDPNYLPISIEFLNGYTAQLLEDSTDKEAEGIKYTYGQRLRSHFGRDQIEDLIKRLAADINSARAAAVLWDPKTDYKSSNPPCLNHIWVRVVEGELSLTATFRSNDMFSAWPANAMQLRALQKHIRDGIVSLGDIELTLGPLITVSQSAHIYDDCWENAEGLINNQYREICRQTYDDPCGNFIIELSEGFIKVEQTTTAGETVKEFCGRNPLVLVREICDSSSGIEPKHIGYLGIELHKASQCLKEGKTYTQDR